MNGYKFRTALAQIAPNYQLGEDNEGQIIIYTNMREIENDEYVEFEVAE